MKYTYSETKVKSFSSAYDAGFDCGLNGADTINSNFKWFRTKESMQEWQRGKRNAELKNSKK